MLEEHSVLERVFFFFFACGNMQEILGEAKFAHHYHKWKKMKNGRARDKKK